MKLIKQLMCVAFGYVGMADSQEHVHGAGSVFVIQEGKNWQVQYVLPASDALGFEHKPETQQQRDILTDLGKTLSNIKNLMNFGEGCDQREFSHNLSEFDAAGEEELHDHEKEHHHDEHEQDGHEEEHETDHQNVEVSYTLRCAKDVTRLSFSIFENMPSLQELEVQWSLASGQGTAMVSNQMRQLELK